MAENTAVVTHVKRSASSQLLLAARNRVGIMIYNDCDDCYLHIKFGGPATTSDFSVRLGPHQYLPPMGLGYDGEVHGVWKANGAGNAHITELRVGG